MLYHNIFPWGIGVISGCMIQPCGQIVLGPSNTFEAYFHARKCITFAIGHSSHGIFVDCLKNCSRCSPFSMGLLNSTKCFWNLRRGKTGSAEYCSPRHAKRLEKCSFWDKEIRLKSKNDSQKPQFSVFHCMANLGYSAVLCRRLTLSA